MLTKKKKKEKTDFVCIQCGRTRSYYYNRGRRRRYCKICLRKLKKAYQKAYCRECLCYSDVFSCKQCGHLFNGRKSSVPRKFCGRACYKESRRIHPTVLICEFCDREFDVKKNTFTPRFCNRKCSARHRERKKKRERRRAKLREKLA